MPIGHISSLCTTGLLEVIHTLNVEDPSELNHAATLKFIYGGHLSSVGISSGDGTIDGADAGFAELLQPLALIAGEHTPPP